MEARFSFLVGAAISKGDWGQKDATPTGTTGAMVDFSFYQ